MSESKIHRRDFVKAVTAGAAIGALGRPGTASSAPFMRANDRINVGLIGVGGRGRGLLEWVMKTGEQPATAAKLVAVSDVYGKRLREAKEKAGCDAYLDYREILERKDIELIVYRYLPAYLPQESLRKAIKANPKTAMVRLNDAPLFAKVSNTLLVSGG